MEPYREEVQLPELAYYYPEPVWQLRPDGGNWIKNLVLFFDGVGLLVPQYVDQKVFHNDPSLAYGLSDQGLLHLLRPEELVDEVAIAEMADFLIPLLESGQLDPDPASDKIFDHLSLSRMGNHVNGFLYTRLYTALHERGLAAESKDGYSLPIESRTRTLILTLWSQFLRRPGKSLGFDFHPVTDNPGVHTVLGSLLNKPALPSAGHVVSLDMETVGVDLAQVPIDEIVDYKRENSKLYRQYRRSVVDLLIQAGSATLEDSQALLRNRKEEIEDLERSS